MANLKNEILFFLFRKTSYNDLGDLEDDYGYSDLKAAMQEIKRLGIVHEEIFDGYERQVSYLLTETARKAMQEMPLEFKLRPYEYFVFLEQKKQDEENIKKWYDSENARLMYEDYPATKRRAKRAEWIAISVAILALLELVLQWIYNKPG